MLDANLWLPLPEISGARERRYADLGERRRVTRRNDRFVLPEHDRRISPGQIQFGQAGIISTVTQYHQRFPLSTAVVEMIESKFKRVV